MVVVIAKNYCKDMGASSAKILTISCGMSRGKLEAQGSMVEAMQPSSKQ
jgi:hypothetical protein